MAFDPLAFLESAVRTPSHDDVAAMRDLLVDTLADAGLDPTVDGAGNVLVSRGEGSPHVVLNTHIDTVPPPVPFERDGETVRGRGACDAKGALAALVAALVSVDPAGGEVTLAVTPDEETRSTGAAALRDTLDPDAVIVGEPTGLDVCNAAKGRFEGTLTLTGSGGHAASATAGPNPLAALEDAMAAIRTFDDAHGTGETGSLGQPLLTPTIVDGGGPVNRVPDTCTLQVDRRSVPPETAGEFADALAAHVDDAVPDGVDVRFDLTDRETPFLTAFETPADEPLVRRLAAASGGDVRPFAAATEASYFAEEAPTVVFGPGVLADADGPVAHSAREYVDRRAVSRAAAAVRETVTTYVA